jgi:hypothetical protein
MPFSVAGMMQAEGERRKKAIADFYREEFERHTRILKYRRSAATDQNLGEVERALNRLLSHLDNLCHLDNFETLASQLLTKVDHITKLSIRKANRTVH